MASHRSESTGELHHPLGRPLLVEYLLARGHSVSERVAEKGFG